MQSTTMVGRLLDLANNLVKEGNRSSALRLRAVSTAYYAVFHALAKSCAGILLPSIDRNSEAYERIYRALDHGPLRAVFAAKRGALNDREALQKIGEITVELQSQRHRADYLPPRRDVLSREQAKTLVDQAGEAVKRIECLSNEDRTTLATLLLFKSRLQ